MGIRINIEPLNITALYLEDFKQSKTLKGAL